MLLNDRRKTLNIFFSNVVDSKFKKIKIKQKYFGKVLILQEMYLVT